MKVKVAQSRLTLPPHGLYSPWNSLGQNWSGSLSLLQGIFPTQGYEPRPPALQADTLPSSHQDVNKESRIAKIILKKNKMEGISLPNIKAYYVATVIKTVLNW